MQVNANLIFTLSLKLWILIIIMQKIEFFFPSFRLFLIYNPNQRYSSSPGQARKLSGQTKTCCLFKTKDWIILPTLAGKLNNSLGLFKLNSKTLLVCSTAVTSGKWQNTKATLTLILLEDISIKLLTKALYKVLYCFQHKTTHTYFSANCNTVQQKNFPKQYFSNFVIKQHNSKKLGEQSLLYYIIKICWFWYHRWFSW